MRLIKKLKFILRNTLITYFKRFFFYGMSLFFRHPIQPKVNFIKCDELKSNPKISILLPTRSRPQRLKILLRSIVATISGKYLIEVVIYVDEDDFYTQDAIEGLLLDFPSIKLTFLIGTGNVPLSTYWNVLYSHTKADIVMLAADDLVFKTFSWDEYVHKVYSNSYDKLILVHGNDGIFGSDFGTHFFLHRRWVDTLGYMVPPYFELNFVDTWLNEVANKVKRRVYIDILIEHVHPLSGKAVVDATYLKATKISKSKVNDLMYEAMGHLREVDALKMRYAILEYRLNNMLADSNLPLTKG